MAAIVKNTDAKTLKETFVIFWGKYKGKKVSEVLKDDPSYLIWAEDNVPFIKIDPALLDKCRAQMSHKSAPSLDLAELESHAEILKAVEEGLDSYGNEGVRELHGFADNTNIHNSLKYFSQLSKYLTEQISQGTELGQLLTQNTA